MNVDPVYASIGSIFKHGPLFRVPKYQRSYAWDKEEIEDFLNDIKNCFEKRKAGTPINHFFGGIVSVEKNVKGTINQKEFELVDGQQRTATFVLLAASIIKIYQELLNEAQTNADEKNSEIIQKRINSLTQQYIEFEQEKNRETEIVAVLILSRADEFFFRDTIKGASPAKIRDSHSKIFYAYETILKKVKEWIGNTDLTEKMDSLEVLKEILDGDLSVIHIKTVDKNEAYVLFRVLNDRGKNLSDGDLLRARVLEMLERHQQTQRSVEDLWDKILCDSPSITEDYLRIIYTSYKGVRPGANSLFDDFLNLFYPQHSNGTINAAEASQIQAKTQELYAQILLCRKLSKGIWPFEDNNPRLTQWDKNRLSILIRDLGLTITLPVLLASITAGEEKFSQIVQLFERFLFRYKIVGNQHIGSFTNIVFKEALLMRQDSTAYSLDNLKISLIALQEKKVPDSTFETAISRLEYKPSAGNSTIKYLLTTIEYFLRWYKEGANGSPSCRDKTRLYDFASTTIEHIYPRNAKDDEVDTNCEPLKNNIGNLTILGPTDNEAAGNKSYIDKQQIFSESSVLMNVDLAANANWSQAEISNRTEQLKNIAIKIFSV